MTREEAIKAWDEWRKNGYSHSAMPNSMALVMAYNALRAPTREQIRMGRWIREFTPRMLPGRTISHCSKCWYHVFWPKEHTDFCPDCGAPMTDEAVDIMMARLEAKP